MSGLPLVNLYTDGSIWPNPGTGGWAAILRREVPGAVIERVITGRQDQGATNITMEMQAVISGLSALNRSCQVVIVTDLQMLSSGINLWMKKWCRQGWRNTEGKRVANVELWQEIYRLERLHRIQAVWQRGHVGHIHNEKADELAGLARLGTLTNYVRRLEGERL